MSADTSKRGRVTVRRLPAAARQAAAGKASGRSAALARSRFDRTFADVLTGRFGGSWTVQWERSDGARRDGL
jgi:hypothetical protein